MQIEQIGIALRTAFARRRLYNQVLNELEAYSDRELADLGLSRYDLHDVALQAVDAMPELAPQAARQPSLHLAKAA